LIFEIIGQDFFHNPTRQVFPFEFDHKIKAFMRATGVELTPKDDER
jgi:hypothetical protein